MPQDPDDAKDMCRYGPQLHATIITFEIYLSASEGQEFLAAMSKTTESDCDCLPDCDLLDLQYSVSSADLM